MEAMAVRVCVNERVFVHFSLTQWQIMIIMWDAIWQYSSRGLRERTCFLCICLGTELKKDRFDGGEISIDKVQKENHTQVKHRKGLPFEILPSF